MERRSDLCPLLEAMLGCDTSVAMALLGSGRLRDYAARAHLARQGESLGIVWLVLNGRIKLESSSSTGRSSRLGVYGPGAWLGSYAQPATSLADIVALEPGTVLSFASGALPQLALTQPQIGVALALSFARQLESAFARLDARSTLTAKGRICAELARRAGHALQIAPSPIVAELALAAQTTRETASRTIAELERRGIITRGDGRLRINSPRLLNDLVV